MSAKARPLRTTCWLTFLALLHPALVLWAASSRPRGVFDLNFTPLLLWSIPWIAYMYMWYIPYVTTPFASLPYPPGESAILAHSKTLIKKPDGPEYLEWMKTIPNDGLIYLRGFAHAHHILLPTTPAVLMEALNTRSYDWEKPSPARRFLSRVLGDGLIVVEGQEHRHQRKAVAAAFTGKHIKDLVPLFWSKSVELADTLARIFTTEASPTDEKKSPVQGIVEIGPYASRTTLDIIGKAAFGWDFGTLQNSENELAKQYEIITNPKREAFLLWFTINMLFPQWLVRHIPWRMNQVIAEAAQNLRRICRNLLARKKQMMEKNPENNVDILSVLMKPGTLSDELLINQLLTFLAAGHETTSNAITWACYLLATHPEAQGRLRKEVQDTLGSFDSEMEVDATLIESMPYLSAVCNETLRFFPTVPVTARRCHRETVLNGVRCPKDTRILICPWAINRLPSLWGSDAEQFNPDRWMGNGNGLTGGADPHAFITFLHGPRSCIGQGFARMEMKCLLAALILKFKIEMADPSYVPVPMGAITIKPKEGLPLKLTVL